jgi:hypothetical protein
VSHILQLEREFRRLRIIAGCGVLFGLTMAVTAFQGDADEVIRAERIELVSGAGIRRAILSTDTLGFRVTLLDEQGRPAGSLRLSDEPRLTVETERGRELAGLGAPKVHRLTE